ncbi:MAG: ATP-binding cassette domain-containing protein [Pseudomonadales bacterium]|nr:ATP-binding cassette domain-containing protein [Candidatus Woesebacteria bacterium]MCB9801749.1 ATP-binding cassette domain-containing protein [Pseudomonadales bacterium]
MIVFQDVNKIFQDYSGVKNITFEVDPGELVFITGNSGSGKTTLMRLLTGDYTLNSGEIILDDIELSKVKNSTIHHLRRKIGVVFQDYKLLPDLNVWENISLPLYITHTPQDDIERRVTDLLDLVGLTDKAHLFPSQLSGGEAQRVSIARALTTGPSVIFADEPTGNLDPETGWNIAKLLHKINQLGTTLLFATHNHDYMEKYKDDARHIHLEKGEIATDSKQTKTTVTSKHTTSDSKPDNNEDGDGELPDLMHSTPENTPEKKPGLLAKLLGKKQKKNNTAHNEEGKDQKETKKEEDPQT